MTDQNRRLALLIQILNPEDYRYIADRDIRIEPRFRRARMKTYRVGLRSLAADAVSSYQARLSNINAAARWSAYPALLLSTASIFFSIGKLWLAGTLFSLHLPILVDLAAQRERLQNFLAAEALSG